MRGDKGGKKRSGRKTVTVDEVTSRKSEDKRRWQGGREPKWRELREGQRLTWEIKGGKTRNEGG